MEHSTYTVLEYTSPLRDQIKPTPRVLIGSLRGLMILIFPRASDGAFPSVANGSVPRRV